MSICRIYCYVAYITCNNINCYIHVTILIVTYKVYSFLPETLLSSICFQGQSNDLFVLIIFQFSGIVWCKQVVLQPNCRQLCQVVLQPNCRQLGQVVLQPNYRQLGQVVLQPNYRQLGQAFKQIFITAHMIDTSAL